MSTTKIYIKTCFPQKCFNKFLKILCKQTGGQRQDSNGRHEARGPPSRYTTQIYLECIAAAAKWPAVPKTSYDTHTFPNLLKLQEPCTDLITCFVPVNEFTQYVLRYGLTLKQKAQKCLCMFN